MGSVGSAASRGPPQADVKEAVGAELEGSDLGRRRLSRREARSSAGGSLSFLLPLRERVGRAEPRPFSNSVCTTGWVRCVEAPRLVLFSGSVPLFRHAFTDAFRDAGSFLHNQGRRLLQVRRSLGFALTLSDASWVHSPCEVVLFQLSFLTHQIEAIILSRRVAVRSRGANPSAAFST